MDPTGLNVTGVDLHVLLPAFLSDPDLVGLVPDEEAMMNFAIALSLQEEVSEVTKKTVKNCAKRKNVPNLL